MLKGELELQYNAVSSQIDGIQEEMDGERSNTIHGSNTSGKLSPVLEASRKRDWAEHALIKQTPLSTNKRSKERDIDDGFAKADANINQQKAQLE